MKEVRRKRGAKSTEAEVDTDTNVGADIAFVSKPPEATHSSRQPTAELSAPEMEKSAGPLVTRPKRHLSSISATSHLLTKTVKVGKADKKSEIVNPSVETQKNSSDALKQEPSAMLPHSSPPVKQGGLRSTMTQSASLVSKIEQNENCASLVCDNAGPQPKRGRSDEDTKNARATVLPLDCPSPAKSLPEQSRVSSDISELAAAKERSLKLHCRWVDALHPNKMLVSMSTAVFKQDVTIREYNDLFSMNFGFLSPILENESLETLSAASSPSPSLQDAKVIQDTSLIGRPLRRIIGDRGFRNSDDELASGIGCPSSPRILINIMHSMTSGKECSFYCAMRHRNGLPIMCHLQCVPLGRGRLSPGGFTNDDCAANSQVNFVDSGARSAPEVCWALLNIHAASLVAGAIQQGVGFGLPWSTFKCNEIIQMKDASQAPSNVLMPTTANDGDKGDDASSLSLSLDNPCPLHERAFGLLRFPTALSAQL
jgi:hypothetical protein